MKLLYVLYVVYGAQEWAWGRPFDNIHACAGKAAAERHAQQQVLQKTGIDFKMKFICRQTTRR
jgi:hypothetical protein